MYQRFIRGRLVEALGDTPVSGIRKLAGACGAKFAFGVVLYDGDTLVPFGRDLAAAPLSCLWN